MEINSNTKITLGLVIGVLTGTVSVVFGIANIATKDFVDGKVEDVLQRSREDRKELIDEIKAIRKSMEDLYKLQLQKGRD